MDKAKVYKIVVIDPQVVKIGDKNISMFAGMIHGVDVPFVAK